MPAPSTTAADEIVVLTMMAASYRSLALASVSYAADLTSQLRRSERINAGLWDRVADGEARIADLEAELARYTRSMIAGSEAA